ncbi:MAG: ribosome biogenesis GTPase Der [Phycisphaeraceae bacterium]|nr:MAG: ribosome biogenesis GTPase Der [Phycisphaeraceae bacterium]
MPVPRIAIVGRPNVGKSSLLNLIAKARLAIVDPTPGVTRDRLSVVVTLEAPGGQGPEKPVELTDTGGFGVYVAEGGRYDDVGADLATLTHDIEHQIGEAVSGADLILFAIDVQAGITPQDLEIAKMLREQKLGSRERSGKLIPVRVMATKVDGPSWETHAYELAGLGFGEPLMCSAKSKYMRRQMLDELYELIELWRPNEHDPDEAVTDLKLAIVGKRNSGKSTLVNTLAGAERVIVSEIAGTTRDAIDVRVTLPDGRRVTAIDTAGVRRKKSFQDQIEWYAFDRAQRAIERADVILLLIDAEATISQVDEQIAAIVIESSKPVIVVVNKWDLAEGRKNDKGRVVTPADYETYIRKELNGLSFAPIAFMAARDGFNVREVVDLAFELHAQAGERVPTGEMNRLVRDIIERHHPASIGGKHGRVYFTSQVKTNPPTIVMIVNRTEIFSGAYERYLMNRLREELPFGEVPIRLIFRSRKRAELAMLKAGKLRRSDIKEGRLHETDAESQGFAGDADLEKWLADLPDDAEVYFDE